MDSDKKLKKLAVEADDGNEKALDKLNKLLDELYKQYEATGKLQGKVKSYKAQVDASNQDSILGENERDKMVKQKAMF